MLGTSSISDSSYTDCALSVTGPYESTAIVTGPMPRKPKATRPNANTAGAIISAPRPSVLIPYAIAISATITMPSQKALKFPATNPERMFRDGPPSRDEVTTSRVCRESTEVKTFTNSGMIAPASVPHVITDESFHQRLPSPRSLMSRYDAMYVRITETIDVNQTRKVRGASKFIRSTIAYRALAMASLSRYEMPDATIMTIRITKIHTRSVV